MKSQNFELIFRCRMCGDIGAHWQTLLCPQHEATIRANLEKRYDQHQQIKPKKIVQSELC